MPTVDDYLRRAVVALELALAGFRSDGPDAPQRDQFGA